MNMTAYIRVSTEDQANSGAGLSAQRNACRDYASRAGTELHQVFADEGISGAYGLEKRPGLLAAIAALAPGDVLLIHKRDRLGRDPIVVAMIESAVRRKGARVVSTAGEGTDGDGPSDILMRRMVDAFAEYERLLIGARTSAALQAKKAKGQRVGSIPYGYRLAGNGTDLEADEAEQAVVTEAKRMKDAGLSLRGIAAELAKRGFMARSGKAFQATQIARMAA